MNQFSFGGVCVGVLLLCASPAFAQASGSSGTIRGTVLDPSGAVIAGASVTIQNPVSHFARATVSDGQGRFEFDNVPFNNYHTSVTAAGFAPAVQDVDLHSAVPQELKIALALSESTQSVTVEASAADLLENDSTTHTDVDRGLFDKLPLESSSSSLSSLVTLATPGISADSNGLFHGFGDHAENSFSIDGQPITDQQSKVFSNQLPLDAVQSMEVIAGAPPAEFGGKTSVVINATTRSGQGITTPTGSVTFSYGSFGSGSGGFDMAYGGQNWGNFIAVSGLDTGRFLDTPEFAVMHDQGNEENLFDRIDWQFSTNDSIHLNLEYTRSWFQNPNSYDQQYHIGIVDPLTGLTPGPTDQRSQIKTMNIAPSWNHVIGATAVFTLGAFYRQDLYNYYPSGDPFSDYSPDLQSESVSQARRLANAGVRSSLAYQKGIHNIKIGGTYEHTLLTENDNFLIVDPALLPPLCQEVCTILAPYDLFYGDKPFNFYGHTDIKELGLYIQDTITKGPWSLNLGLRGDVYSGLSRASQAEPRLGAAYNIKGTNTILRASYARTMESPFNENLIIASQGCNSPFLSALVPPPGVPCVLGPVTPGYRNEFHAGLQQALGKFLVIDGEYIWKYTHNAYDFGVVGNTPITFPIEWQNSKIPGFALRVSVPNYHGFTAQVVMSSVAARFFLPQEAGLPIVPPATGVFRIDHDELFNETTHLQYQFGKRGPWVGFNWRFDSGQVAGSAPCVADTATCAFSTPYADGGLDSGITSGQVALVNAATGAPLTADQEFQAGLTCDGKPAVSSPFAPALAVCDAAGLGSKFLSIPAPGTENDDHNPQRIASRNLFDIALGHDNLFRGDRYKVSARLTVVNLTDKEALYNFLSTFSGTHYVTPRAITGTIALHF